MKIEGDGRQYWLVLHSDPDQDRVDKVLELLRQSWSKYKNVDLFHFLHLILELNDGVTDDELIKVLEENL